MNEDRKKLDIGQIAILTVVAFFFIMILKTIFFNENSNESMRDSMFVEINLPAPVVQEEKEPLGKQENTFKDISVYEGKEFQLFKPGNEAKPEWIQVLGPDAKPLGDGKFLAPKVYPGGDTLFFTVSVAGESKTVKVHVLDSSEPKDDGQFEVSPNGEPLPRVFDAGENQVVYEGETVHLKGHLPATDKIIKYLGWNQAMGPKVNLTDADTLDPSFTAPSEVPQGGVVLEFELLVQYDGEKFQKDSVLAYVKKKNSGKIKPPTTLEHLGPATMP